jgi:hypothetical protein
MDMPEIERLRMLNRFAAIVDEIMTTASDDDGGVHISNFEYGRIVGALEVLDMLGTSKVTP